MNVVISNLQFGSTLFVRVTTRLENLEVSGEFYSCQENVGQTLTKDNCLLLVSCLG